jgi:hypothetical protein
MFNYPVEKHVIRFYSYKFLGYEDKPVVIEAYNKLEARRKLNYFREKNPALQSIPVVSESLTLPIWGETTKKIDNVTHVYVGKLNASGWMPLSDFENLGYEK